MSIRNVLVDFDGTLCDTESVFASRLIRTSSPSFKLSVSRNSFGMTKRPLVSSLIIEFIIHLVGILWDMNTLKCINTYWKKTSRTIIILQKTKIKANLMWFTFFRVINYYFEIYHLNVTISKFFSLNFFSVTWLYIKLFWVTKNINKFNCF